MSLFRSLVSSSHLRGAHIEESNLFGLGGLLCRLAIMFSFPWLLCSRRHLGHLSQLADLVREATARAAQQRREFGHMHTHDHLHAQLLNIVLTIVFHDLGNLGT